MANEMKSLTIGDSVYSITSPINIIHSVETIGGATKRYIPNVSVSGGETKKYITNVAAVLDAIDYMYETHDCSKYMVNFDDTTEGGSASLLSGLIVNGVLGFTDRSQMSYPIQGVGSADDGTLRYQDINGGILTRAHLDENGGYLMKAGSPK